MVHLQGMSYQFQISVINTFYNNFEINLVNFLNVLGFLLLTSEKNGGYTFLICYFLVIDIYCFFDDHDTWLMLFIFDDLFKCLRFLEGYLNAILQFPSQLQERLEKNTHTHTHHTAFL